MVYVICEEIRKARKPHICDDCLKPIQKGHFYNHQICKYDYVYSWKSHVDCKAAAISYAKLSGFYDWSHEGICLRDDIALPADANWLIEHYPGVAARFGLIEGISP